MLDPLWHHHDHPGGIQTDLYFFFWSLDLTGHPANGARVLLIGGIFVFFPGLVQFLLMAAGRNAFLVTGEPQALPAAAPLTAMHPGSSEGRRAGQIAVATCLESPHRNATGM